MLINYKDFNSIIEISGWATRQPRKIINIESLVDNNLGNFRVWYYA